MPMHNLSMEEVEALVEVAVVQMLHLKTLMLVVKMEDSQGEPQMLMQHHKTLIVSTKCSEVDSL